MNAPHRILIVGYYGHGNAGDEAILAAMVSHLSALQPGVQFVIGSADPARTVAEHGMAAISAGDVEALVAAVLASDVVVLGGGGVFQDYWAAGLDTIFTPRHGGLPAYVAALVLAALLGKPAMIYAAGVGPLRTMEGRYLTRAAFALCARATVRDQESLELLAEIGFSGVDALAPELAADPAFVLPPVTGSALQGLLTKLGVEADEPRTAVALRYWDFGVNPRVWEAEVAKALDRYQEIAPGRLIFLSFQTETTGVPYDDDLAVNRRVAAALSRRDRALVVESRLRPHELAGVIGSCRRILAMRYHSALFALAAGVPTAAMAYDPKVASLMAAGGLGDLALPPSVWTASAVSEALQRATAERFAGLAQFSAAMRARALRSAATLLEVLATAPAPRHEARRFLDDLAVGKIRAVARLEIEREALQERLASLAEEVNDAVQRLSAVEATLSYRVAVRTWALTRRLFPEGSRRRHVYRRMRNLLDRRVAAPPPVSVPSAELMAVASAEPRAAAPDVPGDLLRFAELVNEQGCAIVVAVFSGTQLLDSEGQRPTQIALELARRGVPVAFFYWRWSPTEWCAQDRLDQGIVQIPIDLVVEQPEMLAGAFGAAASRVALFEFPYPGFFEVLAALNAQGWVTVYDVLDDWVEFHRVGQATWYEEPFERHLIRATDAVFAVNEFLAARIRSLGGEGVQVVGNGLNPGLATVREPRLLERGEVTVGYFGYLAGAWFDWGLIAEAARRRPGWRFYLIGYGGSPDGCVLPDNVALLGKKPPSELAAYAANWDVAIIPFKPEHLAASADPIKTYEYLAMGLPVVATGVFPPAGGEAFVSRTEGVEGFLAELEKAAAQGGTEDAAARRGFIETCTWESRLDALLGAIDRGDQRVAEKRALFRVPS